MWCSARPRALPPIIDLSTPRRQQRLQAQRRGGVRPQRPLGRLGRRRQRRRLRRPDRRRLRGRSARQLFRRELCGVRQGLGLCRQSRSLEPRRHQRLQAQRRGGGRPERPLGRLGRRRQRRRLRRPDRRRLRRRSARRAIPARAMWCSARPRALPPISISRRLDGSQRLQAQRRGGGRLQRPLGRLGGRRQRRRLRRPDRRRLLGRPARHLFRRELCGVRQGLGLCRQPRSVEPRRQQRLQAQRRGGGRPQRLLGRLGRRRQRRRLRRPDRRRPRCRPARQLFRRELRGVRQGLGLCRQPRSLDASTAATASSSAAWRRATRAASRSPRPATSTATASPT